MTSSSISGRAKEGIDAITKGEAKVELSWEYVEIIVLLFVWEEEIIIIREINDNDAAVIADVLKTNTTLAFLRYALLFYSFSFDNYFESILIQRRK
jgi:hypothetical protein